MATKTKETSDSKTNTASKSISTISEPEVISRFNFGPVTVAFTPPASCLSTLTYNTNNEMFFGHRGDSYFDAACYPPQANSASGWDMYYYSPAQCPLGWAQQATRLSYQEGRGPGGGTVRFPIGKSTTAYICCPSGFTVPANGIGHQCKSELPRARATLSFKFPSFNGAQYVSTDVSGTELKTTVYSTTSSAFNIFGDGIPVWWQSSDTFFATPPTTTGPTPPTTPDPGTTNTSKPPPGGSSGGLSTGGKIGVGVGIPLVVLAIGIVSFFFWHRRRKNYRAVNPAGSTEAGKNTAVDPNQNMTHEPVELQANKWNQPAPAPVELGDSTAYEPYRRSELPVA